MRSSRAGACRRSAGFRCRPPVAHDDIPAEAAGVPHRSDRPEDRAPSGAVPPLPDLERLRLDLYRLDAPADAGRRYAEALAADRERRARIERARPAAGGPHRRVPRRVVALAGSALLIGVALAAALTAHRDLPPDLPAVTRTISLVGPPGGARALRQAIGAGRGDATALVTRTAYSSVPVLRRANRAAGNEAVLSGPDTLNLDALDDVSGRRSVTVAVVCATRMQYAWTLLAGRGGRDDAVVPVAHGSGDGCGRGMDAATVAVPAGWQPRRIRVVAPRGAHYLLSVQVIA